MHEQVKRTVLINGALVSRSQASKYAKRRRAALAADVQRERDKQAIIDDMNRERAIFGEAKASGPLYF